MKDDSTTLRGQAHQDLIHDSAAKHVAGRADYTDDLIEPVGTLHAYLGLSTCAHGRITGMDFADTLAHPGVLGVLTAADLEGLGEEVRARVLAHSGTVLEWEIKRLGRA